MIAMLRRSERTVVPVSMVLDMSSPGAPGHRSLAPGTKRRGSHGRAIVGFYYANEVYQSGGPAAPDRNVRILRHLALETFCHHARRRPARGSVGRGDGGGVRPHLALSTP